MKIKELVLLIFVFCFLGSSFALALDPFFVREFRARALRLRLSSNGKSSSDRQESLRVLKKTGQGNCVAWSKLMVEVALGRKLEVHVYRVSNKEKEADDEQLHRITILKDKEGQLWLQSNFNLEAVESLEEALEITAEPFGDDWKDGCYIRKEYSLKDKELRDR